MMRNRLLAAAACAAMALFSAPVPARAQAEQRAVYVSALDASGSPVANLSPADIAVREDKVQREILGIAPAADPMQIALLVDNSQAAEPFISDYREALVAFINAIAADPTGTKHDIALITLADRPTINTDYTSNTAQLINGAQRIFSMPGSGTYLLDGIIETSRGIKKRESARPVIVAITTEGPELSDRQYQAVLEPLRDSGAVLHVLIVGSPRNDDHDRAIALSQGSHDTGGRYENVLTSNALPMRLRQVAADLTHQFKVTYARPQTLIPPEQVTVTAVKSGLTVRGTAMKQDRERQGR